VFDRQSYKSFEELDIYLNMFLNEINPLAMSVLPVLLLGNKSDLAEREVSDASVEAWMETRKIKYSFNVSAKTGENVEKAFLELVQCLVKPENALAHGEAPWTIALDEERPGSSCC
jgi:GTPase SAR1 family protein